MGIMEWILQNKWLVLLMLEIVAWVSTFLFLYFRYWKDILFWTRFWLMAMIFTGFAPQLSIMVVNMWATRSVGFFEAVILFLVIYSFIWGKKDIALLDRKMRAWADRRRNGA